MRFQLLRPRPRQKRAWIFLQNIRVCFFFGGGSVRIAFFGVKFRIASVDISPSARRRTKKKCERSESEDACTPTARALTPTTSNLYSPRFLRRRSSIAVMCVCVRLGYLGREAGWMNGILIVKLISWYEKTILYCQTGFSIKISDFFTEGEW